MKSRLVVILVASFAFVLAGGCTDSATSHDGPNDKVAIIGDSLTYQAGAGEARITDLIREKGHGGGGIYFTGVGGKRLTVSDSAGASTLENIAAARAQLGHVDTWVIALGTNDRNSTSAVVRASVNEILTALGDDHFVWVGFGFYDRGSAHADRLTRDPRKRHRSETERHSRRLGHLRSPAVPRQDDRSVDVPARQHPYDAEGVSNSLPLLCPSHQLTAVGCHSRCSSGSSSPTVAAMSAEQGSYGPR